MMRSMPALILLNGAPASGKSTIAARLVNTRPLALNLDIDVIRGQLGSWLAQPTKAGLAARSLAVQMARSHLASGLDVVVPQFLGRVDFIQQLEHLAAEAEARFIEVALDLSRSEAINAFQVRRTNSKNRIHQDAAALVDQATSPDPVGDMYDALQQVLKERPHTVRVAVVHNDVDATFAALLEVLSENGLSGPDS